MINDDTKKIAAIIQRVEHFNETLECRPAMLGTPYEVNAMFFFVDMIELIAKGHVTENYFDSSWADFLIHKKIIVGANDLLRSRLINDDENFSEIQKLRAEFFVWRKSRIGI
jgi:hypothetical protein